MELKREFNEKIEKIGSKLNKYIFTPPLVAAPTSASTAAAKSKPEIPSAEDTVAKGNNTSLSSNSGFSQTNLEEKIIEIKTEILHEISRFKSAQEETIHNNADYRSKKTEKRITTTPLYNISYISSIKNNDDNNKYDDYDDKRYYNPKNIIPDILSSLPSPPQSSPSITPTTPTTTATAKSIDTSVLPSINGNSSKTSAMNDKNEKINSSNTLVNTQQQQQPSFNNNSQNFNDIITPPTPTPTPPENTEPTDKQIPSIEGKSEIKDNLEVDKEYANEQEQENKLNKIVDSSSPELQKIEEEILTALKRLGEVKNNFSSDNSS